MTATSTPVTARKAACASAAAVRQLACGNAAFLRQGLELIARLGDVEFRDAPPVEGSAGATRALFGRGAVGAHFRHVLDHYLSFFDGLDGGVLDYDLRGRDRALESDRALCARRIEACVERLERLGRRGEDGAVAAVLGGTSGVAGEGGEPLTGVSSVARELQFLASHTVHHYAIIAVIVRLFGVEPGDEFGVAPSTLDFERGAASCAR